MPVKKSRSQSSTKKKQRTDAPENRILEEVLKAIGRPVSSQELLNVLLLLGHGEFEIFRRMTEGDIADCLSRLVEGGRVVCTSEGLYGAEAKDGRELREIFGKPEYAPLPDAIFHALPSVDIHGQTSRESLQRDIKNAFYSQNIALLNQVLVVMRDSFPRDYARTDLFDFLFDEDEEWLLSLPEAFLLVCAWRLLPSAALSLRPVRGLAERVYALAENAQPMAVTAMLDYALLCGDWRVLPNLLRRLQSGAPLLLRRGWSRFLAGRDEEAIVAFRDALDRIRQSAHAHNGYFKTVGGVFAVLALLREGSPASLHLARFYAKSGAANDTPHGVVYTLLESVVQAKANPDLPPVNPVWHSDCRLNTFFACLAHFWLTGTLDGSQRMLLEDVSTAAHQGGYQWIAEECQELQRRLESQGAAFSRWHDHAHSKLPFAIDCVLTRNSWVERFAKLGQVLEELPQNSDTRLAWSVNTDQADRGILTVKPIEQHSTRRGKTLGVRDRWTKGRRFTAYRDWTFGSLDRTRQAPVGELLFLGLTPQDCYACDLLRETEALLKTSPQEAPYAWAKVIQALVGHPRVMLEGGDGQTLRCVNCEPVIQVTQVGDDLQYHLLPDAPADADCVVRLEQGDQLAVYSFPTPYRHLRDALAGDFQVPGVLSSENQQVLSKMVRNFRVISQDPLPGLDLEPNPTDTIPCVQLTPRDKGLRVEFLVRPFGTAAPYYTPGEGPLEMILPSSEKPFRMVRDVQRELALAEELVTACPMLSESGREKDWVWNVEGMSCYELTIALKEQMQGGKCHVQWPSDNRFICRRTLTMSNVSLHTQSYLSWFSVEGEVKLEDSDATATLADLVHAVAEKKRFVTLDDGQVVALSEKLREQLSALSRLGDLNGGGMRICQFLMPFLSRELENFPGAELPPESNAWIQQYNHAMEEKPAVPAGLQATLRPYQEEGFLWLSRLDRAGAGACLADDMGLGKTVQAITLVLAKAEEGPTLVVAPTSVCANWQHEFRHFAPSLDCQVFGPGDREEAFRRLGPRHVMIASYGLLQSEQQSFRKIQWRVAILDEAQAIKNSHAKRSQAALEIHADFRVVTTGTPVENNLNELWSIFNFIIPGLLGTREGFQHRFATAIEHDNNKDATQNLRGIVSPFLLRRRKDQVLNDLPPKEEIDYPVELGDKEREFYDNLRRQILRDLESRDESEGQKHIRVLSGITKLRLAVDHPRLVPGGEGLSGAKLEAFLELLRRILRSDHKVLVFSQFVKFLEIVRETLDEEGIAYEYLDGARTPKERATAVENFQTGDVPVFLISLKAGGLGLNLTQADYVIHLDSWWNPAVENQASDRAHRLGQHKKVTIYHLQTVNTIEDKIKALHKRKRDLADNLLTGADTIETVPLEELLKLLREG